MFQIILFIIFAFVGFGNDEDIEMNDETAEQPAEESNGQPQETGETDAASKPMRKVTLSYEKYRRIANTLVLFLRQEEDKPMTGSKSLHFFFNSSSLYKG